MLSLLKDLYQKSEDIKGKRLLSLLLAIFFFFSVFGLVLGYITDRVLNQNDTLPVDNTTARSNVEEVSYEGKIRYVDPQLYPEDDISFSLVDKTGRKVILLKSKDMTLVVAENQYGTVYGIPAKTSTGEEVLIVDRVKISNATN
jgi:hypothetical protein